jgi:hypothetical protein
MKLGVQIAGIVRWITKRLSRHRTIGKFIRRGSRGSRGWSSADPRLSMESAVDGPDVSHRGQRMATASAETVLLSLAAVLSRWEISRLGGVS